MAKKRTALSGLNDTLFQGIDPYGRGADDSGDTITSLAIEQIIPDPTQPRQLIPADLINALYEGKVTAGDVLKVWLDRAGTTEAEPNLKRKAQELQQLATSIEQHGLINPITIRSPKSGEILPAGVNYLIVTGERRYWAHIYLVSHDKEIHEGQTTYSSSQIKASLTAEGVSVRAHQLLENLMREDINAVEKAQGLWALRHELSGVNDSSPDGQSEADKLVPWSEVEQALGMSKRYRIFLTSVLNLSEAALAIAFEHDLAEMTIRPITQKLKDYPELQLIALNQLVAWQAENQEENGPARPIVPSVQALVDQLLAEKASDSAAEQTSQDTSVEASQSSQSAQMQRLRSKAHGLHRWLANLKADDKTQLTQELHEDQNEAILTQLVDLRDQIDTILPRSSKK